MVKLAIVIAIWLVVGWLTGYLHPLAVSLGEELPGGGGDNDNAVLSATFLDTNANSLGQISIGPVTFADRGGQTELLLRGATNGVPVGTRQIQVKLTMTRVNGNYDDGYADSLSLVLRSQRPGSSRLSNRAY